MSRKNNHITAKKEIFKRFSENILGLISEFNVIIQDQSSSIAYHNTQSKIDKIYYILMKHIKSGGVIPTTVDNLLSDLDKKITLANENLAQSIFLHRKIGDLSSYETYIDLDTGEELNIFFPYIHTINNYHELKAYLVKQSTSKRLDINIRNGFFETVLDDTIESRNYAKFKLLRKFGANFTEDSTYCSASSFNKALFSSTAIFRKTLAACKKSRSLDYEVARELLYGSAPQEFKKKLAHLRKNLKEIA